MRNRRAIPWRYAAVVVPMLISLAGGGTGAAATPLVSAIHTQPYLPGPSGGRANTTTRCGGCAVTTTWTGFEPGSTISLTLFSDAHSLSEHHESVPQLPHTAAYLQVPVGISAAAPTVGALVVFSARRRKTSGSADR